MNREAYIAAVKRKLLDLGHSEEDAEAGAVGLYSIARKHPDDVDPERDAREWDIGYDASRYADDAEAEHG